MSESAKDVLHHYLQSGREALLRKLDGLSEQDVRRPMTPTGTNLLGLVKHVASVELGYLGEVFDRPSGEPLPWMEPDAEPNADLWATPDETREQVVDLYRRAWAHGDATIAALDLDAPGRVPWWSEGAGPVTLHQILVHLVAETHRHAGHADIVRESLDGGTGLNGPGDNVVAPDGGWPAHRARLDEAAAEAARRSGR